MHCIAYSALYCLQCTVLPTVHCIAYSALCCSALHYFAVQWSSAVHCISMQYTVFYCNALCCSSVHCIALQCSLLKFSTLYCSWTNLEKNCETFILWGNLAAKVTINQRVPTETLIASQKKRGNYLKNVFPIYEFWLSRGEIVNWFIFQHFFTSFIAFFCDFISCVFGANFFFKEYAVWGRSVQSQLIYKCIMLQSLSRNFNWIRESTTPKRLNSPLTQFCFIDPSINWKGDATFSNWLYVSKM